MSAFKALPFLLNPRVGCSHGTTGRAHFTLCQSVCREILLTQMRPLSHTGVTLCKEHSNCLGSEILQFAGFFQVNVEYFERKNGCVRDLTNIMSVWITTMALHYVSIYTKDDLAFEVTQTDGQNCASEFAISPLRPIE